MPDKKNTGNDATPGINEFDTWNEEAEDAAIGEMLGSLKVRHIIKGDKYWCLVNGHTYMLPLMLSIDDYAALSDSESDSQSIDALKRMISRFGGADQAERIAAEPVQAVMLMLDDYAKVILKTQGAGLGKSAPTRR